MAVFSIAGSDYSVVEWLLQEAAKRNDRSVGD